MKIILERYATEEILMKMPYPVFTIVDDLMRKSKAIGEEDQTYYNIVQQLPDMLQEKVVIDRAELSEDKFAGKVVDIYVRYDFEI